jgi:hypothetical protein
MIQQFLEIIRGGEIQSQLDIAEKLKVSPALVVEIARELTRRGYLNEYNGDCQTNSSNCDGCSVSGACHIMGRTWSLTEKGMKAFVIE